ncbi:hypothetical protein [Sabulicella rubraurantiaca]|uniref:hypothetical protein n=1 Tax=Sabulicella rubraurantiaca TaxID=2811429 RepID=UPI001A95BDE7|nr:hypothetical protein [Sabulicella rubraurantiaca]
MTGAAAFWFSLVTVGYWAFWNFHRPHPPDALRYSVTLRRYILGVTLHIASALAVFGFALICARLVQENFLPDIRSIEARTGLPLTAALLVTVLLPRLPGTRLLADETRGMLQRLALYPASTEHLTRLLAAGGCRADDETRAALRQEMVLFGLSAEALDRIYPPAVVARLDETHALRLRFSEAVKDPGLSAFVRARGGEIEEARLEHLRLLRRVARATLLAEELADAPVPDYAEEDHPGLEALSEFVLEETKAVAARYHRLAADAALSMFHRLQDRDAFLDSLGFPTPPPLDLPFGSVVVVAGVMPATVALLYLRPMLEWSGLIPDSGRPPPSLALVLAFSVLQLTIVLWAVLPKALTRWAWPRRRTLPLGSYAVVALGAFLTQAAFGWLMVTSGVMPHMSRFGIPSLQVMLAASLFAIVSTIGLCLLIDRRLLDNRFRFFRGRWLDGLVLAAAMALADRYLFQNAIVALGGTAPGLWSTTILGGLGFVLGALVPSSVAAWLNHRLAKTVVEETAGAIVVPVRVPVTVD